MYTSGIAIDSMQHGCSIPYLRFNFFLTLVPFQIFHITLHKLHYNAVRPRLLPINSWATYYKLQWDIAYYWNIRTIILDELHLPELHLRHQRGCSTSSRVSTEIGIPSWYMTIQPGQLNVVIRPWVGKMSTEWTSPLGWNGEFCRLLRNSRPSYQDCWHTL